MRARALLVAPFLAALLGLGVATASADTLFTNSDYTTRVTVGSSTTATAGTVTLKTGSTVVDKCTSASFSVTLTQNDDTAVTGSLSNGSFNGCNLPLIGDYPWSFSVNGTATHDGGNTRTLYSSASWGDIALTYVDLWSDAGGTITFANTGYGGTLSSGVDVSQSAGDGGPICLDLDNAGALTGSSGTLTLSGAFCTAGTWSLGATANTALYTNATHSATVAVGTSASLSAIGTVTTLDASMGGNTYTFRNICSSSTLNVTISRNSGGLVVALVDGATFTCLGPGMTKDLPSWSLKIGGSGVVSSPDRVFADTRVVGVQLTEDLLGTSVLYSGTLPSAVGSPLANGVYATEPVSPGAPICLVMDNAGPIISGLNKMKLTGRYCFEGTAASTWNLG